VVWTLRDDSEADMITRHGTFLVKLTLLLCLHIVCSYAIQLEHPTDALIQAFIKATCSPDSRSGQKINGTCDQLRHRSCEEEGEEGEEGKVIHSRVASSSSSTIDANSRHASFDKYEEVQIEARELCVIHGDCFKYPNYNGLHDDSHFAYVQWGVGSDMGRCLSRAREWHIYCNNSRARPVTATFVPTHDQYTFPESHPHTGRGGQEWIMLLHVTDAYMDFFDNFWNHYLKIENWSVQHVVKVVVASQSSAEYIQSRYGSRIQVEVGSYFGLKAHGYNDRSFTNIVRQRPSLIRRHLLADRNVLYMDVDVVLQADPFASLPAGYDIWTSMDHSFVHCTGIMALRSTARVIDFLEDWDRQMLPPHHSHTEAKGKAVEPREDLGIGNQKAFNQLMQAQENDDLNIFKLPQALFPPGNMYFSADLPSFAFDRSKVVAVHNNFIIGHAVKKQRFIDHSLWLTTTAKDLSPPTLAPFLNMDEGKQTHRRYEKTEQDGDNTAATRQATKANKDFENRRHPQKRLQQDIMKMRHDQAPLRHPIEELCGISIRIKDVWFLAEQPIDLPFSLLGAVVGANYSFRLAISDSQDTTAKSVYESVTPFTKKQHSKDRIVTRLVIPPMHRQGKMFLKISFMDEYEGLSEDEALLTSTRRIVNLWSEGCRATPIWPPRVSVSLEIDKHTNPFVIERQNERQNISSFKCASEILRGPEAGVTLATIASLDRFAQVATLASIWDGPMSVALYAPTPEEEQALVDLILGTLSAWLTKRKQLLRFIVVCVCI